MRDMKNEIQGSDSQILNKTYGMDSRPYFVYTPRWINSSAGIKALHYLCHALNSNGQHDFIVLSESEHNGEPRVKPTL